MTDENLHQVVSIGSLFEVEPINTTLCRVRYLVA